MSDQKLTRPKKYNDVSGNMGKIIGVGRSEFFYKSIIVLSVLKYLAIKHYRVPCNSIFDSIFPVKMISDHNTSELSLIHI